MILLAGALCGALVAWALGGRLSLLAELRLRATALIFTALGVQLLLFTPFGRHVPAALVPPAHVATYGALVAFTVLNARRSGFWLLSFGLAANALVILTNGGRMPVTLPAWVASGHAAAALTAAGVDSNNVLLTGHTQLGWLGDRFAIPAGIPFATAVSIGDLLIVFGMTLFVYRACTPADDSSAASTFAPLRYRPFRHVLLGRLASSLGDWMAMTAIVTWLFASTGSTGAVSAFLVARILATIAGGAVSAPLLDRAHGFKVLTWVEVSRGALTAGMIPAALTGQSWAVVAFVCLSSFLGAATSPSARGLVPEVLPRELLGRGNALHGVARNVTMVVGTLAAALSVVHLGIAVALLLDCASFVFAALLYQRFRSFARDASQLPGSSRREIATVILRTRPLVVLVCSFTVVTAAMGVVNAGLPRVLGQLGEGNGYGYGLAAIGGGLLFGEFLTGFIRREQVTYRTIPIAFAASAVILALLARTPLAETAYLLLFLLGAADGTTEVTYDTIVQTSTRSGQRAGVFAVAAAVQNGGMILGLAAAPLLQAVSLRAPMVAAALACVASVPLSALLLPRRRDAGVRPARDPGPSPLPERPAVDVEHALAVSQLLERVAESANTHVYHLEYLPDGAYRCHVWVGAALHQLLGDIPPGLDAEDAWEACVHPEDRERYDAAMAQQRTGRPTDLQYRMVRFDGEERWVWERCRPRCTADGRVLVDGIATDVTDLRRLQHELTEARDRLEYYAHHDVLTALPNRLTLSQALERRLAAARCSASSFALLFLDLDGFKQVNDVLGHAAGDAVLADVAGRLRAAADGCLVARMGGDEFVVLTPLERSPELAADHVARLTDRIIAVVEQPFAVQGAPCPVTVGVSIGTAAYPGDGIDAEALLRRADAAMYRRKVPRSEAA
jgi:diguanylate cyclase (GGDEF)-like protein/PAS domain S-box-containing protein